MEFTLELSIFIFFTMFISFIIKGIAGFGDPLISNPLLSLKIDTKFITPSNLLASIVFNGYMTFKNRKSFSIGKSMPMLIAILCGVIPGTLFLGNASSKSLKALLGLLVIFLGIEMLTRNKANKFKGNFFVMLIVSFFSGITAGLFGINLFFVAYIERTTEDRSEFRGQMGFLFFAENMFRLVMYIIAGIFTLDILLLFAIALPGALLGFYVGSRFDSKLSDETVKKIVNVVFIAGGLNILIQALT